MKYNDKNVLKAKPLREEKSLEGVALKTKDSGVNHLRSVP